MNTQQATYESDDKEKHLDYAVRIFLPLDIWEIGLSYFDGTSREPLYNFDVGSNTFIPHYLQMQQVGLAAQATTNDWLWKIEAIHRDWQIENFNAATAGFEYTFVGVFDSSADIGWVAEYLYDDRGSNATSFLEHDLMIGLRLTVNDEATTEALLGFIVDKDTHDTIVSLEANRRIGNSWRLSIEARAFNNIAGTSRLNAIRDDDYVQVEMGYYF